MVGRFGWYEILGAEHGVEDVTAPAGAAGDAASGYLPPGAFAPCRPMDAQRTALTWHLRVASG
ncbi:hypothetical protein GCM10022251_44490 [Phytohabitans flavus]